MAEADTNDGTGWSPSRLRRKEGEGLTAGPRRSAGGRELARGAAGFWLGRRLAGPTACGWANGLQGKGRAGLGRQQAAARARAGGRGPRLRVVGRNVCLLEITVMVFLFSRIILMHI